jgi:4-aminobutyrate aminotransferase-like enzyme
MFAFEADDIVPDVVALSKNLGGGFPLAAVAVTDSIAGRPNATASAS